MKRFFSPTFTLFVLIAFTTPIGARVAFDSVFTDSTLRVDYIFSGSRKKTNIIAEELHIVPGWAGRRHRLDELPLEGNGRIIMRRQSDGKVIYRTSFSSLYQEWLSTDEAVHAEKAFENVFLLPYPKEPVVIDIELNNIRREPIVQTEHRVDPADILIRRRLQESPYKRHKLVDSGNPADCIDVVILAEGYTEARMPQFLADANKVVQALLSRQPFARRKQCFNISAVETPSPESGVSLPRANDWKQTPFGSHFDTFYSNRYLTCRRMKSVHDALIGIPYEHIIILADTRIYGGGGIYNALTISSSGHDYFAPVVVHEFGHSFGGLADEYAYEQDEMNNSYSRETEPWEQNVTNLIDFYGQKWSGLLPENLPVPTPIADADKYTVGLYEGAAYSRHSFYRSAASCRMRDNKASDFCPACQSALDNLIDFYTSSKTPKSISGEKGKGKPTTGTLLPGRGE